MIRRQIAALEREKQTILEFNSLLVEKLRRLHIKHAKYTASKSNKSKKEPKIDPKERDYMKAQIQALKKYGSHINWKSVEHFLKKCEEKVNGEKEVKKEIKQEVNQRLSGCCSHFEVLIDGGMANRRETMKSEMEDDEAIIRSTLDELIAEVVRRETPEEKRFCTNNVLPLSEYCLQRKFSLKRVSKKSSLLPK